MHNACEGKDEQGYLRLILRLFLRGQHLLHGLRSKKLSSKSTGKKTTKNKAKQNKKKGSAGMFSVISDSEGEN